tara:strand:- start:1361 stop:2908 length:1548 start_codon:yes stop_codon:yes gene_type:complete
VAHIKGKSLDNLIKDNRFSDKPLKPDDKINGSSALGKVLEQEIIKRKIGDKVTLSRSAMDKVEYIDYYETDEANLKKKIQEIINDLEMIFGKYDDQVNKKENSRVVRVGEKKSGAPKGVVNFRITRESSDGRKQTPTKVQEKGTTDVFNMVLDENKRYDSKQDMYKDPKLMKKLRKTFSERGNHVDKIDDWINTYFSQQDIFFQMKKYQPSNWSPFEYHGQDFVKFWSDFIKKTKTQSGQPVGNYTTWNPSDIWAVYDKKKVNDAIDEEFKKDQGDPKLSKVNNFLIDLMSKAKLVGISLKKIDDPKGGHIELMNIDTKSMRLARVIELKASEIDLQLDNIVKAEKVTTYIKFAKTHTMNINLNDKKKPGNLSFNTQISGSAAQGGQAPVKLVENLLNKNIQKDEFVNDWKNYPIDADSFWDQEKMWKHKYEILKSKGNSSWPKWEGRTGFYNYITNFYKIGKPQLAITKLMQITFFYDAYKNYPKKQDFADFCINLLHLGMKVGDRFAPHAKIS